MSAAKDPRMELTVNGTARDVPDGTTIAGLLSELDVRRDGIAVALNDDVVPRAAHAVRALANGDRVEIIVAVAGG